MQIMAIAVMMMMMMTLVMMACYREVQASTMLVMEGAGDVRLNGLWKEIEPYYNSAPQVY